MIKFIAGLAILLALGPAIAQTDAAPQLNCEIGPVAKTYGAAPWLVYACSDAKSVVAVSSEKSPAHPFYFMLYLKDGARHVVGEGNGKKEVTAAAYQELIKLTEADIALLIEAARAVPRPPSPARP